MEFNSKKIISVFPWLTEKNLPFIISADYDGLICASFLHHYLKWELTGYYDLETIWISENAIQNKDKLIWVDLNILPRQGRAIGGHIVTIDKQAPAGFLSSCNPNILSELTVNDFRDKFPFSTIIYLLWLHGLELPRDLMARLLILHADSVWLKAQHYPENIQRWEKCMSNYNWKWLFQSVNTHMFEKRIDQLLYPTLKEIGAISGRGKLSGKHSNIIGRQYQFNPDWDEDVILHLFRLFGRHLKYSPPALPRIVKRLEGNRKKASLSEVKKIGLAEFIRKEKIFSYAIPSPRVINYTTFGYLKNSPLDKHQ